MQLPSASKVGLAMRCTLPWHGSMSPWPKEKRSDAGDRGDAVHKVAEEHAAGAAAEEGYEAARTVDDAVRVAIDDLTADSWHIEERAITYNPFTGTARMLPASRHRDYSLVGDGELVGTADLIVVRPGRVWVYDHKTGRGARKAPARESWQLRLLAVAIAALLRADEVTVGLVHVDDGDYRVDGTRFDFWALEKFADELRTMAAAIRSGALEATPGPHCYAQYCPVRAKCPETRAALARAEERALVRLPVLKPLESDDEARSWNTGIKLLEEFTRQAKDELYNYARRQPVALGDGVWLGAVEREGRESVDLSKPGALKAVVKVAGSGAVEYKTSKAAIERATKAKQTKRGEGMKSATALYEELRRRGALVRGGTYTVIEEFRRALPAASNDGEDAA